MAPRYDSTRTAEAKATAIHRRATRKGSATMGWRV